MKGAYTVLQFTKIKFINKWARLGSNSTKTEYIPSASKNDKEINLKVLWESETGDLYTYSFIVPNDREQVWVNWAENIVHIPADWESKSKYTGPGDLTINLLLN